MAEAPSAEQLLKSMPLAQLLGIQVLGAAKEEVRGAIEWKPELCTTDGILHGGTLMAVADTLGALCAFMNLPPGSGTGTIESKTNFFRAVRGGRVEFSSRPLHVGRTTIVVQTDAFDSDQRRVAQTTQTQAVLAPRPS
jgi:uncharacterized protein (TIGR00369 family)